MPELTDTEVANAQGAANGDVLTGELISMPMVTLEVPGIDPVTVAAGQIDLAISRHLPNSAAALRALLGEREPSRDLSGVRDVSTLLILLAAGEA